MGIFDIIFSGGQAQGDINVLYEEWKKEKDTALLLDVREYGEYREGHIAGADNVAVGNIGRLEKQLDDKDQKIYLYCRSGGRAGSAKSKLESLGFKNVINMGGIMSYKGKLNK